MRPPSPKIRGVQPVQDLPDECWALIFSRLKSKEDRDAAALTCRRWRSLEALSRHSLRFVESQNVSQDKWHQIHVFLLQALHTFPNILSLTIKVSLFVHLPYSFPLVFQHKGFASLTFLDLSLSREAMNDHFLQCLALACPSLTHLSLCPSNITDAGMLFLANGCPFLRFLDMSCCSITDKGIDVLFSKCVDMRGFSVEECEIEGWGFRHGKLLEKLKARKCWISEAGLAEILQTATSLQKLNISHNLGKPRLSSIGECCKGLETLNLGWSDTLDDVALETIVECCKNLRALNVSWCHNVTFDGWEALALSCKKLEKLAVTGCEGFDPDSLIEIQLGCSDLRVLKMSEHFASHPSLAVFRVFRQAVEIKLYDDVL